MVDGTVSDGDERDARARRAGEAEAAVERVLLFLEARGTEVEEFRAVLGAISSTAWRWWDGRRREIEYERREAAVQERTWTLLGRLLSPEELGAIGAPDRPRVSPLPPVDEVPDAPIRALIRAARVVSIRAAVGVYGEDRALSDLAAALRDVEGEGEGVES
jgi:hypothetical protein